MKRVSLFATLLLLASTLNAQIQYKSANLTATDAGTCATANACLTLNLSANAGAGGIQLTGTWNTVTVQFEGTIDGTNFTAVAAVPVAGGSAVTSTSAVGAWVVNTAGMKSLRVRVSARTSGTIAATITASGASASSRSSGGSGSGTVSGQAAGVIPLGTSATAISNQSHCDDGITTAATVTCSEPITSSGAVTAASDGIHAGLDGLIGNTTVPISLPSNSAGFLGPNSAAFTSYFGQLPATAPAGSFPLFGTPSSNVSAITWVSTYKRQCEIVIGGTGTSNVLQSGDDAIANNSCFNKTGATETITALYCMGDIGSDTVTVNPTFGATGTGTTILGGALTCGSSYAYSATGSVSNGALTDGSGIDVAMGGTLNAHSIHVLVVYTIPAGT